MASYYEDARSFLSKCSALVKVQMLDTDILDATLFFAIGMERLLKALLSRLNPVFVYVDQSFKNTAPLLYKEHLAPSAHWNKEFAKQPDEKVIAYRLALLRAKEFSPAANRHYSTLLDLSDLRDIIVHRQLSEFDFDKAKSLLAAFLPITRDFATECEVSLPELIGDLIHGLEFLTKQYAGTTEERVKKKLEYYRSQWDGWKDDQVQSGRIQQLHGIYDDPEAHDHAECPACGNVAEFSAELDYDYADGQLYPVGVYPTALRCPFCGFFTDDGEEMDYLGLQEVFYEHQEKIGEPNKSADRYVSHRTDAA